MKKLIVSILLCQTIGFLSTPFTIQAIPGWYNSLNKPFFTPPSWIFSPVWTLLYLLLGISLYLIWKQGLKDKKVKFAIYVFAVQLFLNFLWSALFFGLKSPILGFLEIILLWISILYSILKFYPISKLAAYLLIPYLFWVTFAAILNISIIYLN